jgi:signal transduction histidine kinase
MAFPNKSGNDAVSSSYPIRKSDRRNLVDAELIASVSWMIKLRWLAGIGVIVASWIVKMFFEVTAPIGILSMLGAVILLYNLALYYAERNFRRRSAPAKDFYNLARWQTGLDWVVMTLLIRYSGGIESPLILFFIFHIIIASIFFQRRTAFAFTLIAVGLITCVTLFEYYGVIQHIAIEGYLEVPLYQNKLYVMAVLIFFSSTSFVSAYLVTSIQDRLRDREQEIIDLSEELQRATVRLRMLNEGARLISSTLDVKEVLERLAKSTAKVMGVRACSIRLLDASGRQLELAAVYGLSETYLNKGPVDAETNPSAREALSGKVINIPNVPESPLIQYPEEARREGIQSMLSAPLIDKSGPLGIIRAYAIESNRFTSDDEEFLGAIAAQGSIALENALAYRAISQLDTLKSQFIRMVTHELRSPVSVTRSLLRTIVAGYAGDVSPQQRDILERANRRIEYLQKLVDDLLDVAAGKVDVAVSDEVEVLSIAPILEKVIKRFEIPAQEKNISLVLKDKSNGVPLEVKATTEGMDRVFNNLVSNAIKYTPDGGKVTVEYFQNDGNAQIEIVDTGIGIPENAIEHMFEEFYRAPNAKEMEQEGTGLGLVIVKDTLAKYGGRVMLESKINKGSRFIVVLPLVKVIN